MRTTRAATAQYNSQQTAAQYTQRPASNYRYDPDVPPRKWKRVMVTPDIKLEASAIAMQGHIGGGNTSSININKGTENDATRLNFKLARWRPADLLDDVDGEEDVLLEGNNGTTTSQLYGLVVDWENHPPGAPVQQKKKDVAMRESAIEVPLREPIAKETIETESKEPILEESEEVLEVESKEPQEEATQEELQQIPSHTVTASSTAQPLPADTTSPLLMEQQPPIEEDALMHTFQS